MFYFFLSILFLNLLNPFSEEPNDITIIRKILDNNYKKYKIIPLKKTLSKSIFLNNLENTFFHELCHHIPYLLISNKDEWTDINGKNLEYLIKLNLIFKKNINSFDIFSNGFAYFNNFHNSSLFVTLNNEIEEIKKKENMENFFLIISSLKSIFGIIGESFYNGSKIFHDYDYDPNSSNNDLKNFCDLCLSISKIYKKPLNKIFEIIINESFYFFKKSTTDINKIFNEIILFLPLINKIKNKSNLEVFDILKNLASSKSTLKKDSSSNYLKNKFFEFIIKLRNNELFIDSSFLFYGKTDSKMYIILRKNFIFMLKNIFNKIN